VSTTCPNGAAPADFPGGSQAGLLWEYWEVQNYAVVIHEDPDGGFWGEVPALPGCYSQGETVDELKHNIREAIAGVLEVLKEEGREPDLNIQILDVAV
jgi:predicted RNase H-like HicB family nuclease